VKFEWTEPFKAEYQRLSDGTRAKFQTAARAYNMAADPFFETKSSSSWPANLRLRAVANAPSSFEMTRSFSGPDGRASSTPLGRGQTRGRHTVGPV
jgi:hypothetical protein